MFCHFLFHDSRTGLYNTLIFISPLYFLVLSGVSHSVSAAPILEQRAGSDSSSSSTKIWVPIIVIVIVLLVLLIIVAQRWSRTRVSFPRLLSNFSRAAAIGTGAIAPTTTELTADQLTGNGSHTATTNATSRMRRARRTRRTPSQISTMSLPMYNKEPGEEELVIYRGPQDMEDVPVDAEMAAVHEDDERYSPMPHSPNNTPLLDGDESADLADQSSAALLPEAHEEPRSRTVETGNRHDADSSSLIHVETTVSLEDPDPRGAAPAYFEVVDLDDAVQRPSIPPVPSSPPAARISPSTAASSTGTGRSSNRRSIRNLFGLGGNRGTFAPPGLQPTISQASHARADSGGALSLTSTMSHTSTSNPGHRPSQSSSSLFSLSNPLNRKKSVATLSSNHLTSPSLISLASISAPLTHTAIRTEFTYPKAGPTPEQVKLISSREAFAKFGMPYGPDAIAFAASSQDLNPPPEFELSQTAAASGSRLRSQSHTTQTSTRAGGSGEPADRSSESSGESSGTNGSNVLETPEIRVHQSSRPASPLPDTPATTVESSSPTQTNTNEHESEKSEPGSSIVDVAVPSQAVAESTDAPNKDVVESRSVPAADEPQPSPFDRTHQTSSEKSPLTSPSASPAVASPSVSSPSSSKPPPSSFRTIPASEGPYNPSLRSASRASSFRSFATANESVTEFGVAGGVGSGSETPTASDTEYYSEQETEMGDDEFRPATPTTPTRSTVALEGHATHHALEGTDATIRAAA